MQRRLSVTVMTPAGSGPLTLRCFDSGPRCGFADVRGLVAGGQGLHLAIHLVVAGTGTYRDPGAAPRRLAAGTVFVRRPEWRHETHCSRDYGELSIAFPLCHLDAIASLGLPPSAEAVFDGAHQASAVLRMQRLMEQVDNGLLHGPTLLFAAAAEASSWFRKAADHVPVSLRRIHAFIDGQLRRNLSLAQLAHRAGMGSEALRRAFRRHFGLGPMAYYQQRRMDLALSMLEAHSVKEVAAALGFHDTPAFSRQFKRHFGLPPSRV